ncbi:hypothetical protein MIR68_011087 [Amoeboaphelidium protococcarum]|nr:hypothetical protein MIR68_011087 [Amoeboaphelidium protococcarum]
MMKTVTPEKKNQLLANARQKLQQRNESRLKNVSAGSSDQEMGGYSGGTAVNDDKSSVYSNSSAATPKQVPASPQANATHPSTNGSAQQEIITAKPVKVEDSGIRVPSPPSISPSQSALMSPLVQKRIRKPSVDQQLYSLSSYKSPGNSNGEDDEYFQLSQKYSQLQKSNLALLQRVNSIERLSGIEEDCEQLKADYQDLQEKMIERELEVVRLASELKSKQQYDSYEVAKWKLAAEQSSNQLGAQSLELEKATRQLQELQMKFENMVQIEDRKTSSKVQVDIGQQTEDSSTDVQQRKENENLQKELNAVNAKCAHLLEENVYLNDQIEELRQRIHDVMEEKMELTDRQQTLQKYYDQIKQDNALLKNQVKSLEDQLNVQKSVATKENGVNNNQISNQQYEELQNERNELLAVLRKAQKRNSDDFVTIDQLNHLVEQLQMELAVIPDYIQRYRDERHALKFRMRIKDQLIWNVVQELYKAQNVLSHKTLDTSKIDQWMLEIAQIVSNCKSLIDTKELLPFVDENPSSNTRDINIIRQYGEDDTQADDNHQEADVEGSPNQSVQDYPQRSGDNESSLLEQKDCSPEIQVKEEADDDRSGSITPRDNLHEAPVEHKDASVLEDALVQSPDGDISYDHNANSQDLEQEQNHDHNHHLKLDLDALKQHGSQYDENHDRLLSPTSAISVQLPGQLQCPSCIGAAINI